MLPEYLSPVRIISMALDLPTALISLCVPPMPGITPSWISGCSKTFLFFHKSRHTSRIPTKSSLLH